MERRFIRFSTDKVPEGKFVSIAFEASKEMLEDLKAVYGVDLINNAYIDFGVIKLTAKENIEPSLTNLDTTAK